MQIKSYPYHLYHIQFRTNMSNNSWNTAGSTRLIHIVDKKMQIKYVIPFIYFFLLFSFWSYIISASLPICLSLSHTIVINCAIQLPWTYRSFYAILIYMKRFSLFFVLMTIIFFVILCLCICMKLCNNVENFVCILFFFCRNLYSNQNDVERFWCVRIEMWGTRGDKQKEKEKHKTTTKNSRVAPKWLQSCVVWWTLFFFWFVIPFRFKTVQKIYTTFWKTAYIHMTSK